MLADSPAAAVTFKVDANDVSEVLVSSPDSVAVHRAGRAAPGLLRALQGDRRRQDPDLHGTESALTGIGKQARVLNVRSSAGSADDLWSLVYRGKGFVGAVTVVGPNASQAAVRELGEQAYTYAAKSLS